MTQVEGTYRQIGGKRRQGMDKQEKGEERCKVSRQVEVETREAGRG